MHITNRNLRIAALLAVNLLMLAGCARQSVPAPVAEPTPLPKPVDPPVRTALHVANSNLSGDEAAWHLRSALNVAALACDRDGSLGIATHYNRLLARQRVPLDAAYRAEQARFTGAKALDAHVTKIYNLFAQPLSQARFCAAAAQIAAEASAVPPGGFIAYAPGALARLVSPPPIPATPSNRMAPAQTDGPPWLIQLGAYSGQRAARDAWNRISDRLTAAAGFAPRFEAAPGRPLIRVRIGPVSHRAQAIALCAAAAGAGFDCLPVAPKI